MKTYVDLWKYLNEFCSEWEMFQTKLYQKSQYTFHVRIVRSESRCARIKCVVIDAHERLYSHEPV
jgi:hypothetical protein